MKKRVFRYFKPGDLAGAEQAMDAMSRQGWQALRPGRFVQVYEAGEGVFLHRIGCCLHRPGSGDEITLLAAQARRGWELRARRGPWLLFRKELQDAACKMRNAASGDNAAASENPTLEGHRDGVRALFSGRIARLETLRRWMLVLASVLLLGGYVSDLLPVLYATALPLLVALFATYRIKWMEELR